MPQPITKFEREYIVPDGNNVGYGFEFTVKVTEDSICYIFGKGEKGVVAYVSAVINNTIYPGRIEVLKIEIRTKSVPCAEFEIVSSFDVERVFTMIGAGFGIFKCANIF